MTAWPIAHICHLSESPKLWKKAVLCSVKVQIVYLFIVSMALLQVIVNKGGTVVELPIWASCLINFMDILPHSWICNLINSVYLLGAFI